MNSRVIGVTGHTHTLLIPILPAEISQATTRTVSFRTHKARPERANPNLKVVVRLLLEFHRTNLQISYHHIFNGDFNFALQKVLGSCLSFLQKKPSPLTERRALTLWLWQLQLEEVWTPAQVGEVGGGILGEPTLHHHSFSYLNGSQPWSEPRCEIPTSGNTVLFWTVLWPREMREKKPRITQNVKLCERKMENTVYCVSQPLTPNLYIFLQTSLENGFGNYTSLSKG